VTYFEKELLKCQLRLNEVIRVGLWFNRADVYKKREKLGGAMVHICNLRTWEAKAGGS
jgi:hypothetical protein